MATNEPIDVMEDDDSVEEINKPTQGSSATTQNQERKRKKKKLTSKVWQGFTILEQQPNERLYCKCNKCGKRYLAESNNGTGNLKRHLKKCNQFTTKEIGQYMVTTDNSMLDIKNPKFNQERFKELMINALLRHDLPFSFLEYDGVRSVLKYLEPNVSFISRNTAKSEIGKLHQREKSRLRAELLRCPGRICLTSDCWTSIVTDGYLSLTAYYVDSNWVLQKRILNFSYMPPPHTGIALAEKISDLVKSWGIEKKLFSITLDNASTNDVCADVLRRQLCLMNSLVFNDGKLFHVRSCAHILNLIVKDGLKKIDVAVEKVRECVKYVKGSQGREEKFISCCSQTNLDSKRTLKQDVPTRWNSTYDMLSSALYFRLAFCYLSSRDSSFQCCPSNDEWERVDKICSFLKLFKEVTLYFSGSLYPTSNLFFPNIFEIHLKLAEELKSQDEYMKLIAKDMWVKFNKYWGDFSLLLAIAVVFDPRYKLVFVEFSYEKLYDEKSIQFKTVKDTLYGLFNEYKQASNNLDGSTSGMNTQEVIKEYENASKSIFKEFDLYDTSSSTCKQKCQLTEYLEEPRIKGASATPIQILDYWKAQQYRYPDVARLAMDILCVPVTTVASESAFSVGGRVVDQYRSVMSPSTVEAVICTRDWLFAGKATSHGDNEVLMDVDINKDDVEDDKI